jgi:hypothetical protein
VEGLSTRPPGGLISDAKAISLWPKERLATEPGNDRVERWVTPGLRKSYTEITSSQLLRGRILQYCVDQVSTAITIKGFAVQAQIHTSPNDGLGLGVR